MLNEVYTLDRVVVGNRGSRDSTENAYRVAREDRRPECPMPRRGVRVAGWSPRSVSPSPARSARVSVAAVDRLTVSAHAVGHRGYLSTSMASRHWCPQRAGRSPSTPPHQHESPPCGRAVSRVTCPLGPATNALYPTITQSSRACLGVSHLRAYPLTPSGRRRHTAARRAHPSSPNLAVPHAHTTCATCPRGCPARSRTPR